MAGILHEFTENTRILSSEVNENFVTVQNDIEEIGNSLTSELSKQITSAKNDLLNDIETVSNNRADLKLSNIENEGKSNIVNIISPNYDKKIDILTGYTASEAGWVFGNTTSFIYSNYWAAYVNGVLVGHDGGQYNNVGHFTAFVGVGDVITWSGYNKVVFCPCKGVE